MKEGKSGKSAVAFLQNELDTVIASISATKRKPLKQNGFYDRLLRELLSAARGSISRDDLLDTIFNALETSDASSGGRDERRIAKYIVLLEGSREADHTELAECKVRRVVGGHPSRNENFQIDFANTWRERGLADYLLIQHQTLDFELSEYSSNSKFVEQLSVLMGDALFWISAVPLAAASPGQPERAIIAIYESKLEGFTYLLPPGGQQEWMLLQAIPDVYALLNHQLNTVAEQVARQRLELIMELAPTAIFHEVGTGLNLILESAKRSKASALSFYKANGEDEFVENMIREILSIENQAARAWKITEAFNNIEKRNAAMVVPVRRLIDEACTVLDFPLRGNGIKINFDAVHDFEIETDAALVEHVILNVVHNAIDAIASLKDGDRNAYTIWFRTTVESKGIVSIEIANNGPPIKPEIRGRMFQKGVTTKGHGVGHGHGLYICRLVANYLGGTFDVWQPIPKSPAKVGFTLAFPRKLKSNETMD